MTTVKHHEEFLRAFDNPTKIYKYLHIRSTYSPIFLQRNLSYMKGRKCATKRKRPSFNWENWHSMIKARNKNRRPPNSSLEIKFLGFFDEKNSEVDAVDIDMYLTQDKARHNNNNDKKQMIRSITVDANRLTTSLQPIVITRDELLQCTTAADKSCVIFMDISYTVMKDNPIVKARGRPRAAKRLQKCYDTQITIFNKNGLSNLLNGEYELRMNGMNSIGPRFDQKTTYKTLYDNIVGNKKSTKNQPELRILLKWNRNEYQPKPKSIPMSPHELDNHSMDDWCESIGNNIIKRKYHTRHRDTYSSDDSICTGATKCSTDDGDYVAHGSIESSTASTSSLSTSGVSSDMGSDDNEMIAITAKKIREGFTILTGLTDLTKYSGCRSSSIGIVDFGRQITYTFKYNQNGGQQTERCIGFTCPWCLLSCVRLHPLLMHLRLCHDRFRFDYEVKPSGTHIEVSINDQYHCVLASSKTVRSQQLKRPHRRIPYTKVLVPRLTSHYKHIKTFDELKNLLDDDEDATPDAEEIKYQDNQRSTLRSHNRLYYRTTNAMPYTHAYDFDYDSEGEHDPEWQRAYTHQQINDFTDVNEGEKEMFKLWNLFVTKQFL